MGSNQRRKREYIEVLNTEEHLHTYERWFGSTGGDSPADRFLEPFLISTPAGAETFGTPVEIFDGTETPVDTGMTHFDFHKIFIVDVTESNASWKIQIAHDGDGDANFAAAVAAGHYTEFCVRLTINQNQPMAIPVMMKQIPVGSKIWMAVMKDSAGAEDFTFLVGLHEYNIPNAE